MPNPIVIDIAHQLGRVEAKRRIASRVGDLAGKIPGGMARVDSSWPADNRMQLDVGAFGQRVNAALDVEEEKVRVTIDLPPALSFMSGIIASTVRERGEDFLLPDRSRDR